MVRVFRLLMCSAVLVFLGTAAVGCSGNKGAQQKPYTEEDLKKAEQIGKDLGLQKKN